ncbi:acetylornithine deacetylase [Phyllobacterium sp. 0TCS1.6C]|uniref:acetylornithine deacetylase n=1 Tax=unclassified Phyllobacterium TaxID=2638441 RepID=UPI002264492C|nr:MULTISPECIES: acetylornithine deacetylase [unclassified Phyllobacterium]MCX8278963.1 acetylornithine deacetylase [Phyllobacterium sp. 0TCS1.6C]MCX8293747.1 acetylornithine deacetylase [Phyllobacterium sp. 0TCS1.6A]
MSTNSARAVEILERLVAFNTVSHRSNLELIHYVRDYLDSHGMSSTIIPDASGQKANIFATIGDPAQAGYVLSGHTDVVPVEGQEWQRDPFKLTREGGRLYGRGTTDMKGFVACALAMAPALKTAGLRTPIHLAFSYDEEVGCLGVHGLVDHLNKAVARPRAVFVGEPTAMRVVDSHKGSCGMLTKVTGFAAHSSRVDLGTNAIFAAATIIEELHRCADQLASEPEPGSRFVVPYSSVSVGVINGGTARNTVAGDCSFQWDIRATRLGLTDEVQDRIAAFVDSSVLPGTRARHKDARVDTSVAYDVPPLVAAPGSEAEALAKRFAGTNETMVVDYGSEAGIFQKAGMATVLCGPGQDSEAHITDEWIALEQIDRCMRFLEVLADHARAG